MARRVGAVLISKANDTRSIENSVASSAVGTAEVVGKLTSTGKYKPWAPGASDGTEVVAGVCYRGAGTNEKFVRIARDAEVKAAELVYPNGQLAAATAGLFALGIIVR
jgi:hypothetical protein